MSMGSEAPVRIVPRIPEAARARAAELYWHAFSGKLGRVLGPDRKARAFLMNVLDPGHGIAALDARDRLVGIAGYKTSEGALIGGDLPDLQAAYGRWGGFWRGMLLSVLERPLARDTLLMDGIAVVAEARGQGVGTALLAAIRDRAAALGLRRVRLDVIDSNPRARVLYEREGFVAGKTESLGPLAPIFGFKRATTMCLTLADPPQAAPD